jgi:hypothetical protein
MTASLAQSMARCQTIMAHAWMVRTFVKHSPEVEEFPELMDIVRGVFDLSRALETRVDEPAGYLLMLKKKIGKLRKAADKFRHDAPLASTHTNFQQAVISIDACVAGLEEILAAVPNAMSNRGEGAETEIAEAQEDQME